MQSHLARHLERISLFALLRSVYAEEEDEGDSEAADSNAYDSRGDAEEHFQPSSEGYDSNRVINPLSVLSQKPDAATLPEAARWGDEASAKRLLQEGADPNAILPTKSSTYY